MAATKAKNAHVWERDPNDWYVEPSWVWERFFAIEPIHGEIFDPCCGMGRCVEAARAAGHAARGHDLIARFPIVEREENFLEATGPADNICCNPPFGLINEPPYPFLAQALRLSRWKTALIVQASWLFGEKRSRDLEKLPLYRIYHIAPKPSMPPGAVIMAGQKPNSGQVDYVIAVFLRGYRGHPTHHWLRRGG